MEKKILLIINDIRIAKGLSQIIALEEGTDLRKDLGFSSFDLAELTVRVEDEFGIDIFKDGIVNTIAEVYEKLK